MLSGRLGLTWLLVIALGTLASAQSVQVSEDTVLRGVIVTHEDAPVTSGTVAVQSPESASSLSAAIDREGRFHAVLSAAGLHRLTITVPGFAPHRVNVVALRSRMINLPAIRLTPPTYFRARFVTVAGEPILSPNLRRRFLNADGQSLYTVDGQMMSIDSDGATVVGPLPRGMNALMLDMPMLAQTPVGDIIVTGTDDRVIDNGTIRIQPGTVLHVDVVDGTGAPVPGHAASLEPVSPFVSLMPRFAVANQQGRATFDRLAAAQYRVKTTAIDPCNRSGRLSVSRLVVVNGAGEARERIELDGVVRLVVSSPFGPLAGAAVSIGPDVDEPPVAPQPRLPGRPVPPAMSSGRCSGTTDAEGRVSFTHVPPGPIRIDIRSGNSTYQRHATARGFGPELAFDIPAGFLQVQVTDGSTGRPVVNASITWNGRGYRAQTSSNGTGAALLEGVGDGEGTIEVVARGFATDRTKVSTESAIHEVSLVPDPPTQRRVRVVGPTGAPVPNAIVELLPPTEYEIATITVTDGAGGVLFTGAPAGPLSAIVSKDGFKPATVNIPANADAPVVVALTPAR